MKSALTNIGEQIVKEGNDFLTRHGFNPLNDEKTQLLVSQISDLLQPDHRIRLIVRKCLYCGASTPPLLAPYLYLCKTNLFQKKDYTNF